MIMVENVSRIKGIQEQLSSLENAPASVFEQAANHANAIMRRANGAPPNQASTEANEKFRTRESAYKPAAKVFLKTLTKLKLGLALSPTTQSSKLSQSKKLQELIDKHQIPNDITDIEKSISDKSLVEKIYTLQKALIENQINVDAKELALLKLCADEPYTVAMRELHGNLQKDKMQLEKADPNYKKSSGPVKAWHFGIAVTTIVAMVQSFRKGLIKGLLDPITAFSLGVLFISLYRDHSPKAFVNLIKSSWAKISHQSPAYHPVMLNNRSN